MNYTGTIIEESLENTDVLKDLNITSTRVEKVVEKHQTPWLKQWTLHKVEISEHKVDDIARQLSKNIEGSSKHGNWYADFKNDRTHYIIFPGKIFRVDRTDEKQYEEATRYGISLGIPAHQVDFSPHVKKWER